MAKSTSKAVNTAEEKKEVEIVNGGLTPEQIEQLKRENKGCLLVSVKGEDGKLHQGYVKDPYVDKKLILVIFDPQNNFERGEKMLELGWLAGDTAIKDDIRMRVAAAWKLANHFEMLECDVKKN